MAWNNDYMPSGILRLVLTLYKLFLELRYFPHCVMFDKDLNLQTELCYFYNEIHT